MTIDKMKFELVTIILNLQIDDNLPSIKNLANKYNCSRGIIQNSLAFLEQNDVITLEKSNVRTIITNINYQIIELLFFPSFIIQAPHVPVGHKLDSITYETVNKLSSVLNSKLYVNFTQISEKLPHQIFENIHFAIISKHQYDHFFHANVSIICTYEVNSVNRYHIMAADVQKFTYNSEVITSENDISSTSNTRDMYYLVCETYIKNLIDNLR